MKDPSAISVGDTVAYKRTYGGEWRDATVVGIDLSSLLPIRIKDDETGSVHTTTADSIV